jgi:hypothetical protein
MPVSPATIDTIQGLTFSFNSVEFRAKSVKVKRTVEVEDVSDCTLAANATRKKQVKPLKPGATITLEYWGKNAPQQDASYALACTALGLTGVNAICTDFEEGGAAGEFVTGTATFEVTG